MLHLSWIQDISAVYCSHEQKAIDGAEILADHLGAPYVVTNGLQENDRSSTGYLESVEFENTADAFFSFPERSTRGWETAQAAQTRIVGTLSKINQEHSSNDPLAIVSHGAVGTLLYCYLSGIPIDRHWDQPGTGGGNYLKVQMSAEPVCTWWIPIDLGL